MSTPNVTPNVDSTPQQPQGTPMISPDLKSVKVVPAEQIADAKANGWDNAVKMQGPKGELKWVPSSQVVSARQSNFAVTPDNPGVQKMVTPQGQVNYALPGEIASFESNGQRRVDSKGNVLPTAQQQQQEDNASFTRSAALSGMTGMPTPNMNDQEKQDFQSGKATGYVSGMATIPAVVLPTAAPEVASAGFRYLGRGALPGLEEAVGKQIAKQAGKQIGKVVVKKGTDIAGLGILGKLLEWF